MSAFGLVQRECANFAFNGCTMRDSTGNDCLVRDGERCDYFERCLLPLENQASPPAEPKLQAQRKRDCGEYRDRHLLRAEAERSCECGAPLAKRQRFCTACKTKKRRETYRATKKKAAFHS